MPMRSKAVTLVLSDEVRASLAEVLRCASEMPDGAQVIEHLPANPWGDVEEFRNAVHRPLHGEPASIEPGGGLPIAIRASEIAELREVLDSVSESYAGGSPWVALTEQEREVISAVLARLAGEQGGQ
jgi:hypothetical protein